MTSDPYLERARKELAPKVASAAYVITISPVEIDPKIALETGYAILLDKPIILVSWPGRPLWPGLQRIATHQIELAAPMDSEEGQQELTARLSSLFDAPQTNDEPVQGWNGAGAEAAHG